MTRYSTRRSFLQQTASLLSVGVLDVRRDSPIGQATGQARHLPQLPGFEGQLSFADAELQMAADDWGRFVHRLPLAVLRPRSAADISRLVILPEGRMPVTVRLQRRASAENAPDHTFMLAANQTLVDTCLERGGRIYPPFAPPLSREYWERHYGSQTWQRFAAAKRRFDPNNVLTPGAGVFT